PNDCALVVLAMNGCINAATPIATRRTGTMDDQRSMDEHGKDPSRDSGQRRAISYREQRKPRASTRLLEGKQRIWRDAQLSIDRRCQ
ncbi:MAG TPA: hypothetical protein VH080_08900, partial [Gemmatimonadaceae bacterium]|nr:hypothetical protein [Gemmatimonadaceae bacterium]